MDRERNEDLNPHGDDIEEKIRRMLDPSVPDDAEQKPELPKSKPAISKPVVSESNTKQTISVTSEAKDEPVLSAPPLPTKNASSVAPAKKITITEHNESPDDLAQKLDAAIAELDEPKPKKNSPKKVATKKDSNTKVESEEIPSAPPITPVVAAELLDKNTEELTETETETETDVADKTDTSLTIGDAIDRAEIEIKDPAVIKDPATDRAIDEIIASESDEILEIEDAVRDTSEPIQPKTDNTKINESPRPTDKPKKHRAGLGALFKSRAFRWIVLLFVIGGLIAAGSTPGSRYFILNTVGVRSHSSLTVLDDSTQQPLKNVQVSIGGASGSTDANGEVTLTNVKLGINPLIIQKHAFAPITKSVVIGWGSNPLDTYGLTPTGTQYEFKAIDYLSGKPLAKVQASSGEADASSNDQGIIKLTLDKPRDDEELKVTLKLDGYRDDTQVFNPSDTSNPAIKLVPAQKQLFVSKRSGTYDVYSIYVDGKDEKVVLAGKGSERDDMVLVAHPTEPTAAYVSTRGNQHNSQGYLLSDLTMINTDDNTSRTVVTAERIQIVDWSGDYLVYVQIVSGESASSPKRYRLMSYNLKTTATKELASSNYFNDVVSVGGDIYYAPSSAYQSNKASFYKIKADGSGAQTVFNQEVWNSIRMSYDHLALAVEQQWYDYRVGSKEPIKLNAAPSSQQPRVYIDSPNGKKSAWVDVRDGKGVLLIYDPSTKNETVIETQSGLTYPVRWLNDSVLVYRVKNGQETADYAVSTNGGNPVKIRDVTNTGGIDRWYYY